jgi:hypothetical protein
MKCIAAAILICLPWAVQADNDISKVNRAVRVSAGQTVGEVSSVNGSVHIEDGVTAQDVDTVNGSISIGKNARVGEVETVNGSITLGDGTKAASVGSVNGAMKLGENVQVEGEATTVNGSMVLAKGSSVKGSLENVNGSMSLDAARVGGRLKTVNGDIKVGANSHVAGGMLVEKPGFGFFNRNNRNPKITIGPNAVVEGTLKFERDVDLFVSDTARIGKVEGATPMKFSGDEPGKAEMKVER